jgi:hypothetical protein
MIKNSMKFLCYLYPDIKGIIVKDNSISIAEIHIAQHGMTWFQDVFGAIPFKNPEYYNNLKILNEKLSTKQLDMSFRKFYSKFIKDRIGESDTIYNLIRTEYKKSNTFTEFITNIYTKTHNRAVFYKWVSYYMSEQGSNSLLLENMHFLIPKEVITQWKAPL